MLIRSISTAATGNRALVALLEIKPFGVVIGIELLQLKNLKLQMGGEGNFFPMNIRNLVVDNVAMGYSMAGIVVGPDEEFIYFFKAFKHSTQLKTLMWNSSTSSIFPKSIFQFLSLRKIILTNHPLMELGSLSDSERNFLSKIELEIGGSQKLCRQLRSFSGKVKCLHTNSRSSDVPTSPNNTIESENNNNNGRSSNVGLVVGFTIGGVFLLAFLIGCIISRVRKHKNKDAIMQQLSEEDEIVGGDGFFSVPTLMQSSENKKKNNLVTDNSILGKDAELVQLCLDRSQVVKNELISRGGFGEVWFGKYNHTTVAIKQIFLEEFTYGLTEELHKKEVEKLISTVQTFASEIKILAKLHHPRIVTFIGCYWSNIRDLSLVTEYLPGGDLCHYLRAQLKLKEKDVQEENIVLIDWMGKHKEGKKTILAMDILEGLMYLYSCQPKIIHRDLKSNNVLLTNQHDPRAKLTDFGMSRELYFDNNKTMTGDMGTVHWMAPEILSSQRVYTEKVDIYSYGVILAELDTLKIPYEDMMIPNKNTGKMHKVAKFHIPYLVLTGQIHPTVSDNCPPPIAEIVSKCCQKEPDDRPTALEVFYMFQQFIDQE